MTELDGENALGERAYVTLPFDGAPATVNASSEASETRPDVVYAAERIAADTEALAPRALVMVHGKDARRVIEDVSRGGMEVVVPFTRDHRARSFLRLAHGTVCLGERYSEQLYSNAHAVAMAARECGASVVFLCEESIALANVDSFLAHCKAQGIAVFATLDPAAPTLGWVACETRKEARAIDRWTACRACGLSFDEESTAKTYYTCPACGAYLRITSDQRIADLLDIDSFREWDACIPDADPLDFPGYAEKVADVRERTGLAEAVRCGEGSIAGLALAIGVMEPAFLMGSMGQVVGEKLARLFDRACERGLPVVVFTASGGARMQEGLISLMQMAKVSCAVARHGKAGLPYFSVICDPTTGGVTASFAMQGDIVLAEPGALVGFAGKRVIQDTIRQELPAGFQTAEFALVHGLVDAVVRREDLRATLANLIALHRVTAPVERPCTEDSEASSPKALPASSTSDEVRARAVLLDYPSVRAALEGGRPTYNHLTFGRIPVIADDENGEPGIVDFLVDFARNGIPGTAGARTRRAMRQGTLDAEGAAQERESEGGVLAHGVAALKDAASRVREQVQGQARSRTDDLESGQGNFDAQGLGGASLADTRGASPHAASGAAWESVQLARNTKRPTARYYIDHVFEGFVELHGDGSFADDGAIVGGVAWLGGRAVTVIGEEKGAKLKERIKRNFGCPNPEGYRKSLRLMRQAEKFGRPVVCLVDTQGAFCGAEAEERGQGRAIADNLLAMAQLAVPVVSVLIGEGGSGGALALALADRVAMQEHAVYSVLSPEGFASILWKDRVRAPEAAAAMRMGAADVCAMGIVDEVLAEGAGPAHENPDEAARVVKAYIERALDDLSACAPDELLAARHARFARF